MSCSICNEIYYKWEISILLVVLSADLLLLRLQYTLVNVQTKPQYSPNITISLLSSILRNHYEKLFLLVLCHLPLPRIYLVPMERTCITSHLPRIYLLPRGTHVYHITSPSYLSTPSWNARVSHHISLVSIYSLVERTCITSHLPRIYLLPRGTHVYHITFPISFGRSSNKSCAVIILLSSPSNIAVHRFLDFWSLHCSSSNY